jgi:hypothetical protein
MNISLSKVRTKVFEYFLHPDYPKILTKDSFCKFLANSDSDLFQGVETNAQSKILGAACSELSFICKTFCSNEELEFSIVNKDLSEYDQEIKLNGTICLKIASLLNEASRKITGNNQISISDSLNISSDDIESILAMAEQVLANLENSLKERNEELNSNEQNEDVEQKPSVDEGDDLFPPFLK